MADKENIAPPPLKKRLSLSLKKKDAPSRFASVDETALDSARAGVIPDNTAKNNRWALNKFAEWTKSRASSSEPVPEGILSSCDAELVTKWLSLRLGNMPESGKRYHLNPYTCSCVGFIEIVNRMVFHSIFLIKACFSSDIRMRKY